jgi:hypothetical protein
VAEAWAKALAAGVDDAVFWLSSPAETVLLMTELRDREGELQRAANERTALLAAELYNTAGKQFRGHTSAKDFFATPPVADEQALRGALIAWASRNEGVRVQ